MGIKHLIINVKQHATHYGNNFVFCFIHGLQQLKRTKEARKEIS
jgi:hypothetical protein